MLAPQQRISILPLEGTIAHAFTKSGPDSAANTEKSRRDHFILFLSKYSITDPSMQSFSYEDRNMVIACYAIALCNDDNLANCTINGGAFDGAICKIVVIA